MGEPCALRIFLGAAAAPRSLEQSTILRNHFSPTRQTARTVINDSYKAYAIHRRLARENYSRILSHVISVARKISFPSPSCATSPLSGILSRLPLEVQQEL